MSQDRFQRVETDIADIRRPVYPIPNWHPTEVTSGDAHANFLGMINHHSIEGIISLSPEQFVELRDIYFTDLTTLTKEEFKTLSGKFIHILNNVTIHPNQMIRLIGDELCDRGMNDYFMLLYFATVLRRLREEGKTKTDILLSNHGAAFLEAYFKKRYYSETFSSPREGREYFEEATSRSLYNLGMLVEKGYLSRTDVEYLVEEFYLPCLRAAGQSVDAETKTINVFVHAPVDIGTLKELGEKYYGVEFKDDTPQQLAASIDKINAKLHTDKDLVNKIEQETKDFLKHVEGKKQHEETKQTFRLSQTWLPLFYETAEGEKLSFPLLRLTWNRGRNVPSQKNPRPPWQQELDPRLRDQLHEYKGYKIRIIHGHDGELKYNHVKDLTVCIDSNLGKADALVSGKHVAFICVDGTMLQPKVVAKDKKEEKVFVSVIEQKREGRRIEPAPEMPKMKFNTLLMLQDQLKVQIRLMEKNKRFKFWRDSAELGAAKKLLIYSQHKRLIDKFTDAEFKAVRGKHLYSIYVGMQNYFAKKNIPFEEKDLCKKTSAKTKLGLTKR